MTITNGLLTIVLLAFIISMLVAAIIWMLGLTNPVPPDSSGTKGKFSIVSFLKDEFNHFLSFQNLYRTYWYKDSAPTNELITFYHEP